MYCLLQELDNKGMSLEDQVQKLTQVCYICSLTVHVFYLCALSFCQRMNKD